MEMPHKNVISIGVPQHLVNKIDHDNGIVVINIPPGEGCTIYLTASQSTIFRSVIQNSIEPINQESDEGSDNIKKEKNPRKKRPTVSGDVNASCKNEKTTPTSTDSGQNKDELDLVIEKKKSKLNRRSFNNAISGLLTALGILGIEIKVGNKFPIIMECKSWDEISKACNVGRKTFEGYLQILNDFVERKKDSYIIGENLVKYVAKYQ